MYKALHIETGEEIIILSPMWKHRIPELRVMDQKNLLVCQGCFQPLRVKSGPVKRSHFAHKHVKACTYGTESYEILEARAVLYNWLEKQFGDGVTVEKTMDRFGLPRPIDCWVETKTGSFGYWIIESGIKLEPREVILNEGNKINSKLHWVFLHKMLTEEKREFHSLLLTPTERAFLVSTEFDYYEAGISSESGYSLHYFDPELQIITTFRNLALFHRPNWYKGFKRISKLDEIRVNRFDGEIIHPGELERLNKIRQHKQRISNKLNAYQEIHDKWSQSFEVRTWTLSKKSEDNIPNIGDSLPELPCVQCGQLTTDYWSTFTDESGRKLCHCRECLDRDT